MVKNVCQLGVSKRMGKTAISLDTAAWAIILISLYSIRYNLSPCSREEKIEEVEDTHRVENTDAVQKREQMPIAQPFSHLPQMILVLFSTLTLAHTITTKVVDGGIETHERRWDRFKQSRKFGSDERH